MRLEEKHTEQDSTTQYFQLNRKQKLHQPINALEHTFKKIMLLQFQEDVYSFV